MLVLSIDKNVQKCYYVYIMETTTRPPETTPVAPSPEAPELTPEQREAAYYDAEYDKIDDLFDLENIGKLRDELEHVERVVSLRATLEDDLDVEKETNEAYKKVLDSYVGTRIDEDNPSYGTIYDDLAGFGLASKEEWYDKDGDVARKMQYTVGGAKVDAIESVPAPEWDAAPEATTKAEEAPTAPEENEREAEVEEAPSGIPDIQPTPEIIPAGAPSSEEQSVEKSDDPAIEAMRNRVNGLRATLAELTAKRSGRLFSGSSMQEKFAKAQSEYNDAMHKLGQLELSETLNDETIEKQEKVKAAVDFVVKEQEKLKNEALELMKNTKVSKMVEWLTTGNRAQRALKGVAVGAAAGIAGSMLGSLAGVAGVAGAAAGVAATVTAASRFARAYAQKEAKSKKEGSPSLDADAAQTEVAEAVAQADVEDVNYLEMASAHVDQHREDSIDKEQNKRRKSVAFGLAGVALGGAIGFGASLAFDNLALDGWGNRAFNVKAGASPVEIHDADPTDLGGATEQAPAVSDDLKDLLDTHTGSPDQYGADVYVAPDPAYSVLDGEGGIGFFQSLGLTESDWYDVQSELAQKFPSEFYTDPTYGDVRIMNSGPISVDAQQFIKTRFKI